MRKRTLWACATIVLLAAVWFRPWTQREVLENGDSFVLYSIQPKWEFSNTPLPAERFHGYPVLGKVAIAEPKTK